MGSWRFYGRQKYIDSLAKILDRKTFFFVKIEGRRRIGKSRLVVEALRYHRRELQSFRVQIPDAEPGGLITAFRGALEVMFPLEAAGANITSLYELAEFVGKMIDSGKTVVLDEFQYLNRERLRPLLSFLQAVVDARKGQAGAGGLIVAGSIYTEMNAILEDRDSPLFGRVTDKLEIDHFTPATIRSILEEHQHYDPLALLFYYTTLEGVPKYYEDTFERGLFGASRLEIIKGLFFDTSAPLASEAETWFLSGLKGRYLTIMEALAQGKGFAASHQIKDFLAHTSASEAEKNQIGAYIETLILNYRIVERQQPIFVNKKSRHTRYAICDNFLRTWLHAIKPAYQAKGYRPLDLLLGMVDRKIRDLEGLIFEKLVRELVSQRSREGLLDFNLTDEIGGYWNDPAHEIDQIFIDNDNKRVRFGSCKRDSSELLNELKVLPAKVSALFQQKPFSQFKDYTVEYVFFSPEKNPQIDYEIVHRNMAGLARHVCLNQLLEGTAKD